MSEYQYNEFIAMNRPLTQRDMAELRKITTRATITPSRLQNVYHWGDFKGDPDDLMEKYFDAFLYVANWGTNQFMLRLPAFLLDVETASLYCSRDSASARVSGQHIILDFLSEDEEGGGWIEDEEAEGWLPSLIPLRAELATGDLRVLYLGWLHCAETGELDDDEVEPPVPPGLGHPSAALSAFIDFMRIDEDLVAIAAQHSAPEGEIGPSPEQLRQWIHNLPVPEKDALLLRFVQGNDVHLRGECLRRFRHERMATESAPENVVQDRRTVADLLAVAKRHAEVRRREEAEREARERARRQREEAEAREVPRHTCRS